MVNYGCLFPPCACCPLLSSPPPPAPLFYPPARDEGHVEYSGEQQAICAVGLARPRPGVFMEAIHYLLVLATPVEVVLVGVCLSPGSDPSAVDPSDRFRDLTLQALPMYTVPSDSCTICCVAASPSGRIFAGGSDGHLYEVVYASGKGWGEKKCRLMCHSSGVGRWLLPSFLRLGTPDPLVQLAVDDQRQLLFTRAVSSSIACFDLGDAGDAKPTKVAECPPAAASSAGGGAIVHIRAVASDESATAHLLAVTATGTRVFFSTSHPGNWWSSAPYGGSSSGRRPSTLRVVAMRHPPRQDNVASRMLGGGGGAAGGGGFYPPPRPLQVDTAYYSRGVLLLSDASTNDVGMPDARLLLVQRNVMLPSYVTTSASAASVAGGLRELLSFLPLERSKALAMEEVTSASLALGLQGGGGSTSQARAGDGRMSTSSSSTLRCANELTTQHVAPPRQFVAVCSDGLLLLEKRRPVDVLSTLLQGGRRGAGGVPGGPAHGADAGPLGDVAVAAYLLEEFFRMYSPAEAAAMCLMLATGIVGEGDGEGSGVPSAVKEAARAAFCDPSLVGSAHIEEEGVLRDAPGGASAGARFTPSGASLASPYDMGRLVLLPEMVFSHAHQGALLLASRLLLPLWDSRLFEPLDAKSGGSGGMLRCLLDDATCGIMRDRLLSLEAFLRSHATPSFGAGSSPQRLTGGGHLVKQSLAIQKRKRADDAAGREAASVAALCVLLRRSAEALRLLQLMVEPSRHVGRLLQRVEEGVRPRLPSILFRELVAAEEGEAVAGALVNALMEENATVTSVVGATQDLSGQLRSGCPSFFGEEKRLYFQAKALLQRAKSLEDAGASSTDVLAPAHEALSKLLPLAHMADVANACSEFEAIGFYEGVVDLCAACAKARDPTDAARNPAVDPKHRAGWLAARGEAYERVVRLLKSLRDKARGGGGGGEAASKGVDRVLKRAFQCPDVLLHGHLYKSMITPDTPVEDMSEELLALAPPSLEQYLIATGGMDVDAPGEMMAGQVHALELLRKMYGIQKRFREAAVVAQRLAERSLRVEEMRPPAGTALGDHLWPLLQQRLKMMSDALLAAKSASGEGWGAAANGHARGVPESPDLVEILETKLGVLRFQQRLLEQLLRAAQQGGGEGAGATRGGGDRQNSARGGPDDQMVTSGVDGDRALLAVERARELAKDAKMLSDLYNDYACAFKCWGLCLEMLLFANHVDADGSHLLELWNQVICGQGGDLAPVCDEVRELASRGLYPSPYFPLEHITLKLEKQAEASGADGVLVPRTLWAVCRPHDDERKLLRVYGGLLARRVDPSQRRLLSSATWLLEQQVAAMAGRGVADAALHEAGRSVMDLCDKYVMEGHRLGDKEVVRRLKEVQARWEDLSRAAYAGVAGRWR
eukprot:jgi/Mesvir1/26663/Mv20449-RA.2